MRLNYADIILALWSVMMKRSLVSVFVLAMSAASANAATFVYDLFDHPDGNQADNFDYGLRLDSQDTFWTFGDPDGVITEGEEARLTYDSDTGTASISGLVFQSTGVGTVGGLWNLDYTFDVGLTDLGGGGFTDTSGLGGGSITAVPGGTSLDLENASNRSGTFFTFDNDGNRLGGHPEFDQDEYFVGRGWVLGGPGADDFLFLGTLNEEATIDANNPAPVPLPASSLLILSGLGGLVAMRRRKKA